MRSIYYKKIVYLKLTILFLFTSIAFAEGEWTTNSGGNIYNTNPGSSVGIGTTSPGGKLGVKSSGMSNVIWANASDGSNLGGLHEGGDGTASFWLYDAVDNLNVLIRGAGNTYFNGGNVGIGTGNPGAQLEVSGTDGIRTRLIQTSARAFNQGMGILDLKLTGDRISDRGPYISFNAPAEISVGNRDVGSFGVIADSEASDSSDARNYDMSFMVRDSSAGMSERLRIKHSGNVGIGTSTPSTRLQIDDATTDDNDILTLNQQNGYEGGGRNFIRFTQGTDILGLNARLGFDYDSYGIQFRNNNDAPTVTIKNNSNVGIGTTVPSTRLQIDDATTDDNDILTLNQRNGYESGGRNFIRFTQGTDTLGLNARLGFDNDSNGIQFRNSNDVPTVTVKNNGNVGIGTTNPQSQLAVNGVITAKEIKVESGWSDFVFDEDYDLASLDEVESFILKNKHLPDIPSAKVVVQQGLAVSEILAKQMQKIEEMTLYLIELKKENDQLRERVAVLEGSIKATVK